MGSEVNPGKLRVLGLHGYRTNGAILEKQLAKWSPAIHDLVDFTCLDAPTPAKGKSDVEAFYKGPYFEWMQFNDDYSEFYGYEESIAFTLDYMEKNGPFDGLIGFSQGATLSGVIAAVQERARWNAYIGSAMGGIGDFERRTSLLRCAKFGRVILGKSATAIPKIKFVIFIGGARLRDAKIVDVYDTPIDLPTLHLIGDKDFMKQPGEEFLSNWKDPVVIRHPQGHTIPRLDAEAVSTAVKFLKSVKE